MEELARRTLGKVGLIAAAAGLAGCSSDPASPGGSRTGPVGGPSPDRAPSSSPDVRQSPATRAYRPSAAEVDAEAKRVAARAVEALREVEQVTFTQFFGYLPPQASVLVEADFVGGGGTTYAVRISRPRARWTVDSIEPAGPARPAPDVGSLARRVLRHDRIDLPWAGRRDIRAGRIADPVLTSMLVVAEQHRIGISVLVAAHPTFVFGTDRRSNHADGRAYDVGRVDGRLVVEPAAADRVRAMMRVAAATGAYQVGGPVDLDGAAGRYFTDVTHSDHVHVGFGEA